MSFALAAIGSIVGGIAQSDAARKASRDQRRSSESQLALQREMFNALRDDGQTARIARDSALSQLMAELGLPAPEVMVKPAEMDTRTIVGPERVISGADGRIVTGKHLTL